eukprot:scaffold544_cov320-Pavlova_lutheri.AAC.67
MHHSGQKTGGLNSILVLSELPLMKSIVVEQGHIQPQMFLKGMKLELHVPFIWSAFHPQAAW